MARNKEFYNITLPANQNPQTMKYKLEFIFGSFLLHVYILALKHKGNQKKGKKKGRQ